MEIKYRKTKRRFEMEKKFTIFFYNRFACQFQSFKVLAKNKHVARHKFWAEYPKESYYDCIEFIEED